MIESGKCSNVTVSDVSAPSLQKAEKLLYKYVKAGVVKSICCDGLTLVDKNVQTVLIAGMGGEEIIKILKNSPFLPPILLLQPMKNTDKVRKALFDLGYGIIKDYIFYDKNKYYNLLVAHFGVKVEPYNEREFAFGRDNLNGMSEQFKNYLRHEISVTEGYAKRVACEKSLQEITQKLTLLREILNENS